MVLDLEKSLATFLSRVQSSLANGTPESLFFVFLNKISIVLNTFILLHFLVDFSNKLMVHKFFIKFECTGFFLFETAKDFAKIHELKRQYPFIRLPPTLLTKLKVLTSK